MATGTWNRVEPAVRASQAGFTLIELVLVILLIGLSVTFITLRLAPDTSAKADLEARRFAALIGVMNEESIVNGEPIAIVFDADGMGYRFLRLDDKYWAEIGDEDIFRPRRLQEPVQLKVRSVSGIKIAAPADDKDESGEETDQAKKRPTYDASRIIVADPAGQIPSFDIVFYSGDAEFSVSPDQQGRIHVTENPPK